MIEERSSNINILCLFVDAAWDTRLNYLIGYQMQVQITN